MKKITAFILVFIMLLPFAVLGSRAYFDSGEVTSQLLSEIYYMENLDEGTVFFEKASTEKTPAAGFIKLIAAITILEKWGNLDGNIKINEKNLNLFTYEMGMTTALYEEDEVVSKRELFDCTVVYSANDSLSILGYEAFGSLDAFIAEMQKLVEKIGCKDTEIRNIHGFDNDEQYTTARDVAKIIKYGLTYPAFAEAFSADEVTLKETEYNEERTYYSSNGMLNAAVADYYHSAVTGGKQTSTDKAGQCIAAVSSADGYSYLTIVMRGKMSDIDKDGYNENTSMTDARKMLDWVCENIRYRVIVSPEQTVAVLKVIAGKDVTELPLVPEKESSALVPSKASPASVMFKITEGKTEEITPPVSAGQVIAKADVYFAGTKLTTVNLVASRDIDLSPGGLVKEGVNRVVGSVPFLIISLFFAVLGVAYFAYCLKQFIDFRDVKKREYWADINSPFDFLLKEIRRRKKAKTKTVKKRPSDKRVAVKKSTSVKKGVHSKKKPSEKKPPAKKSVSEK